ncbi:MAG: Ig-like domain-containing protein [bacterium]|nr:Ig-like domain-containing protein [bacterium]
MALPRNRTARALAGMIALLAGIAGYTAGCTLDIIGTSGNPRPTVEFLYPADNTSVLSGTDVQIRLLGRDENGTGIARVELSVDDQPHQQGSPVEREAVPVFTVEMNWLAQGEGLHQMTATAYRIDGTASTPVTIRIAVIDPNTTSSDAASLDAP